MTLEEGIKLANEGDLGAQISLGNYYMEQKDLDEAKKWYVIAAEKTGSPYATYMAALTSHTNALGSDLVINHQSDEELGGMFDFFLAEWEDTYLWFNRSIACKEKNMNIKKVLPICFLSFLTKHFWQVRKCVKKILFVQSVLYN